MEHSKTEALAACKTNEERVRLYEGVVKGLEKDLHALEKRFLELLDDTLAGRFPGYICGAIAEFPGELFFGGCGKEVLAKDEYRCADCTVPFHRTCILKHFQEPTERERILKSFKQPKPCTKKP